MSGLHAPLQTARRWIAVMVVLVMALWLPLATIAQEQPVLPDESVAVVDGQEVDPALADAAPPVEPQVEPLDPNMSPAEATIAAVTGDPAAPIETPIPSEDAVLAEEQPVMPELLPVMDPSIAPPSTGYATPNFNPPSKVYVEETGQPIGAGFLDVWRSWGAAASWGNPLTPEITEDGVTVQYLEYGRLEYYPDDPSGNWVQFGKLGDKVQPFLVRRSAGASAAQQQTVTEALGWLPVAEETVDVTDGTTVFIPETGHSIAGDILTLWWNTGDAGYLGNPISEPWVRDGIEYQAFERGLVSSDGINGASSLPIGTMLANRWGVSTAPSAQNDLPTYSEMLWTPPPVQTQADGAVVDPNAEKWVLVSLSQQYLWAYQGDVVLWQGYISSGREPFDTPTGTFYVLTKYEKDDMEGVLGGEYYNVPEVPDVMYFTNEGHALHGAYWHNNFGTPMSHGCVNLPLEVAHWMYAWSPMGMRVKIVP